MGDCQKAIETLSITKQDSDEFMSLRKDVMERVRKSLSEIEDVNNKIEATDNYLARYLPFNTFCNTVDVIKTIVADLIKNPKMREQTMNYQQYKMKELYQAILFDDGRAPKFNKSMLVVDRGEINNIIA